MIDNGLIDKPLNIKIGLAAGKVYKKSEAELKSLLEDQGMFFWGPSDIKSRLRNFASKKYENDPVVIAAKLLLRED